MSAFRSRCLAHGRPLAAGRTFGSVDVCVRTGVCPSVAGESPALCSCRAPGDLLKRGRTRLGLANTAGSPTEVVFDGSHSRRSNAGSDEPMNCHSLECQVPSTYCSPPSALDDDCSSRDSRDRGRGDGAAGIRTLVQLGKREPGRFAVEIGTRVGFGSSPWKDDLAFGNSAQVDTLLFASRNTGCDAPASARSAPAFGQRTSRASSAGREQGAAGGHRTGAADAGREISAAGALWQRQLVSVCLWAVGELESGAGRADDLTVAQLSGIAGSSHIPFGRASSGRLWG